MAGYSATPLIKKLGIKEGHRIRVFDEPVNYWKWLGPLPAGTSTACRTNINFVHMFVKSRADFEGRLIKIKRQINPDGMIWVSWPKKSSKMLTDLDEGAIRDFALNNGLVDVKVCAVDDTWSGLKLVILVKERRIIERK